MQNVKLLLNHVKDGPGYGCLVHSTNLFYREIAGLILFASNSNPVGLNSYKDWGCCQFEKKKKLQRSDGPEIWNPKARMQHR